MDIKEEYEMESSDESSDSEEILKNVMNFLLICSRLWKVNNSREF